jgi:Sec-independent protein translocase protein TatA
MLNLDPAKLLIIAVVAIILLGPDRLPHLARQVGGVWRTFNDYRHRMETEVRASMPDLPSTTEIARLARSPSALLNHLSNISEDHSTPSESADPLGSVRAIDEVTPSVAADPEKSPAKNVILEEGSPAGDPGLN